ncbi:MAG: phytanoyl-CoA dioxygenase family protein [Pseudomonadota bacterium]
MSVEPESRYGVLFQDEADSVVAEHVESVRRLGYTVVDAGLDEAQRQAVADAFDETHAAYVARWGEQALREAGEFHTIRAPLTLARSAFLPLATNRPLMEVLQQLIVGTFILNQQNGIINPPNEVYSQRHWHRDLPYQHFVSSTPLALNALYCVDDFTLENGSTSVLPASHQSANFPSDSYVHRHQHQVEAKAGQYILLDCMVFHKGGFNTTQRARRAVNHVYTIPYVKQQVRFADNVDTADLSDDECALLGLTTLEPLSVEAYLRGRGIGT